MGRSHSIGCILVNYVWIFGLVVAEAVQLGACCLAGACTGIWSRKRLLLTCPVCLPGGWAHSGDKPTAPGHFTVHTVDIFSRVVPYSCACRGGVLHLCVTSGGAQCC